MFVHKSQLEHLLRPDQYFSAAQHELEMRRLFDPTWHLVGTVHDLPRNSKIRRQKR
jgi:hypothetical protein